MLVVLGLVLCFDVNSGEIKKTTKKKSSEYISIIQVSKLKKYNKNAVWKKVPCKRCKGTGSETKRRYNASTNTMRKWRVPCLRCKGKGYKGMSKM